MTIHKKTKAYTRSQIINGVISLFLLIGTILYLNLNHLVPDKKIYKLNTDQKTNQKVSRELTDIKINDFNIGGNIVYENKGDLWLYDLTSKEAKLLVDTNGQAFMPNVLKDGRLYFWSKNYDYVYIQNGKYFEKWQVPRENNDSNFILSQNGQFIIFLSPRDALDNYHRKAIYKYDLTSFSLEKLTENATMNITELSLSSDGNMVAFLYQSIANLEKPSEPALGLLVNGSKNVNLYPKINILNSIFTFSADNQYLIFNNKEGIVLFNIDKGKIVSSAKDWNFRFVNKNTIGADLVTNEVLPFSQSCTDKEVKYYAKQMALFNLENDKLINPGAINFNETLVFLDTVYPLNISTVDVGQILLKFQNSQHCDPVWAIYNVKNPDFEIISNIQTNQAFIAPEIIINY